MNLLGLPISTVTVNRILLCGGEFASVGSEVVVWATGGFYCWVAAFLEPD